MNSGFNDDYLHEKREIHTVRGCRELLTKPKRSSLDLATFGLAGFGAGGAAAVVGLFDFVMRFGHGNGSKSIVNEFSNGPVA